MICFSNASLSLFGKGLPLLSARLMIPRQAFALKKYFRATHGSKTSNKEHTFASLGHAEKLRIQYSPCQTIPERIHFGQELAVSLPPLACERSWDVLPDKPTWTEFTYRSNVFEHESGSSRESFTLACDREGLTVVNGNSGCHIAVVIFNLQVVYEDIGTSDSFLIHTTPISVIIEVV